MDAITTAVERRQTMSDLIERETAIEAIENTDWYHQNRNKDMVSGANDDEHQAWYKADDIYKALESIPSARPKGKCKFCKDGGFIGARLIFGNDGNWHKIRYCPNCGADMTEREGE